MILVMIVDYSNREVTGKPLELLEVRPMKSESLGLKPSHYCILMLLRYS